MSADIVEFDESTVDRDDEDDDDDDDDEWYESEGTDSELWLNDEYCPSSRRDESLYMYEVDPRIVEIAARKRELDHDDGIDFRHNACMRYAVKLSNSLTKTGTIPYKLMIRSWNRFSIDTAIALLSVVECPSSDDQRSIASTLDFFVGLLRKYRRDTTVYRERLAPINNDLLASARLWRCPRCCDFYDIVVYELLRLPHFDGDRENPVYSVFVRESNTDITLRIFCDRFSYDLTHSLDDLIAIVVHRKHMFRSALKYAMDRGYIRLIVLFGMFFSHKELVAYLADRRDAAANGKRPYNFVKLCHEYSVVVNANERLLAERGLLSVMSRPSFATSKNTRDVVSAYFRRRMARLIKRRHDVDILDDGCEHSSDNNVVATTVAIVHHPLARLRSTISKCANRDRGIAAPRITDPVERPYPPEYYDRSLFGMPLLMRRFFFSVRKTLTTRTRSCRRSRYIVIDDVVRALGFARNADASFAVALTMTVSRNGERMNDTDFVDVVKLLRDNRERITVATIVSVLGKLPMDIARRKRDLVASALILLSDRYLERFEQAISQNDAATATMSLRHFDCLAYGNMGNLWLLPSVSTFYRDVLDHMLRMPQVCTLRRMHRHRSDLSSAKLLAATTRNFLIVLLARISNDMLVNAQSFANEVLKSNAMLRIFTFAMNNGYVVASLPFSYFVERDVVTETCRRAYYRDIHDARRCCQSVTAIWYMLTSRNAPYVDDDKVGRTHYDLRTETLRNFATLMFDDDTLAGCALRNMVMHRGLGAALLGVDNLCMPTNVYVTMHRYFYSMVWRFVNFGYDFEFFADLLYAHQRYENQ